MEKKERAKEIKNNDHFAISWQITIHQIVQITDISQWRTPRSTSDLDFCNADRPSTTTMTMTAIRLHQFYGNKLLPTRTRPLPDHYSQSLLATGRAPWQLLPNELSSSGVRVEFGWPWIGEFYTLAVSCTPLAWILMSGLGAENILLIVLVNTTYQSNKLKTWAKEKNQFNLN